MQLTKLQYNNIIKTLQNIFYLSIDLSLTSMVDLTTLDVPQTAKRRMRPELTNTESKEIWKEVLTV